MACALLLAGCVARLDPGQEGMPISFSAGSQLLRDDVLTKSGTPKTGTSFAANDSIAVFGWHNAASELMTFGTTTPVTFNGSSWTYAPPESWQWQGSTDYYDFLAIYPYSSSPAATSGPLTATVTYDPTSTQYDLMTASMRRKATDTDPTSIVPLTFTHRLAAVRVNVINDNDVGGQAIRLDTCCYRNLIVGAKANCVYQNESFSFSWSDYVRSSSRLLGTTQAVEVAPKDTASLDYDLMIPQGLSPLGSVPSMVLTYTPKTGASTYGSSETPVIQLSTIAVQGGSTTINSWSAGTIYTYNITIRVGGGVIVNVTTTPWDEQEVETPGIMI